MPSTIFLVFSNISYLFLSILIFIPMLVGLLIISEYLFLDNSACNLASINLMRFRNEDNSLNIPQFQHACSIFFTAQEILVDLSSYPTKEIAKNSHEYRPLGLGYANLGTYLMVNGIPYNSKKAQAICGAITAILCGTGYETSAKIAKVKGPFKGYKLNKKPMLNVMRMHRKAAYDIKEQHCPRELLNTAQEVWENVVTLGKQFGYRNAQATVIAPTGTIGLLMDCDTTGIEPEFSIVKWKKLAGGGYFKIVNQSVLIALRNLGYTDGETSDMMRHVLGHGTIEGAPHVNMNALEELGYTKAEIDEAHEYVLNNKSLDEWTPYIDPTTLKLKGLTDEQIQQAQQYISGAETLEGSPHMKDEHLAIFDCANRCGNGERFIEPLGHIYMMAAAQPFISGAISKTVNIPNESTEKEIEDLYLLSHKLGLKCVALYRDGCKLSQPLNTKSSSPSNTKTEIVTEESEVYGRGVKEYLPPTRRGLTTEVLIGGQKVYIRTGEYENGRCGEIFVDMHKEGAAYRSMMSCFAMAVSIGLQHGVPLEKFVDSFTFTRFEPNGITNHENIKTSTSVIDFIFRLLGMEYLNMTGFVHVKPIEKIKDTSSKKDKPVKKEPSVLSQHLEGLMGDAPPCTGCGHITVRNGSCYKCLNCGNSMGCS